MLLLSPRERDIELLRERKTAKRGSGASPLARSHAQSTSNFPKLSRRYLNSRPVLSFYTERTAITKLNFPSHRARSVYYFFLFIYSHLITQSGPCQKSCLTNALFNDQRLGTKGRQRLFCTTHQKSTAYVALSAPLRSIFRLRRVNFAIKIRHSRRDMISLAFCHNACAVIFYLCALLACGF